MEIQTKIEIIEKEILSKLEEKTTSLITNLTYTNAYKEPILSITVHRMTGLDSILSILNYKYLADKTGILVLEETNTLILSGMGLGKLIRELG